MGKGRNCLSHRPPIKILIVHIQEQIWGSPIWERFRRPGIRRQVVGPSQVHMMSAWTIKCNLRVSLKISCLQNIYKVVICSKYSLRAFFSTSTKLGYEMYHNR